MLFHRNEQPLRVRLYHTLRRIGHAALSKGVKSGRGTRYVAYSRGCGGGTSFLVREETTDGACTAYAVLATWEESGIMESSFASADEALEFVAVAVNKLRRG